MIQLPDEIIRKIMMYCHPVLDKRMQYQIIHYNFKTSKLKKRYCNFCYKVHRFPRHFLCY